MTETRTGPLGCSNYDNLDSVSSVLVQSPENKVQLQGLYYFYLFRLSVSLLNVNIVLKGACTRDEHSIQNRFSVFIKL